jgi:hypothetical protein
MKPILKAPESKHLKLKHEKTLSNFAFKFNLRRFNQAVQRARAADQLAKARRCRLTPG